MGLEDYTIKGSEIAVLQLDEKTELYSVTISDLSTGKVKRELNNCYNNSSSRDFSASVSGIMGFLTGGILYCAIPDERTALGWVALTTLGLVGAVKIKYTQSKFEKVLEDYSLKVKNSSLHLKNIDGSFSRAPSILFQRNNI